MIPMKTRLSRFLLALAFAALLPGCETFDSQPSGPTGRNGQPVQPRVGMTKAEVIAAYGTPTRSTLTSRGEIWTYWTNKPGLLGFSMGGEPKTAGFVFDPNGYVVDFHVSQ